MSTETHQLSNQLGIGASVTWCHASANGRSIGFTTRHGKIIDLNHANGMACAKFRGKLVWLPIARFRSAGARSELTEMVMADQPSRT